MRTINVGLIGCGTVGTGVARLLLTNRELIRSRVGAELNLMRVADIDTKTDRGIRFDPGVLISNADGVIDDPAIDIIVEMIGGKTIAKTLVLKALNHKKAVVTANKALLAEFGSELFAAAADNRVDLAYEASVGGCMPVIKTIREAMAGDRIVAMTGILNGTCNYILSKITDEGCLFEDALKEAQAKGYAEADPTLDVEGLDTAHKLSILNAIAYGMKINLADIYVEGISRITPMDIEYAGQFGYRVKLLAVGKDRGHAVEARVHPTMIPFENILSNVNGALNAVMIRGEASGDMLLYGRGAGMMPTANAVVADIVDITRNILFKTVRRVPPPACREDAIINRPVMSMAEVETSYYMRFTVEDRPGVLSLISGILGHHAISIRSVHQKGVDKARPVTIVMLTHIAREAGVRAALAEIEALDVVKAGPMLIRVEDDDASGR